MKIFFTGVSGLMGRYFIESNPDPEKYRILGTSRIARPSGVFESLSYYEAIPFQNVGRYCDLLATFKPDVIIHAGGEGNVDLVQQNPEAAYHTNYQFPIFMLEQAAKYQARVVQFSSNAAYDGKSAPYHENSSASPVNTYGELKAKVDVETRSFPGERLIFRPIVAYGWNFPFGRSNPISQFVPLLMQGRNLNIVDDVYDNPVYAGDVAAILWKCLEIGLTGELNVGGGDQGLNRYDWMRIVAEVFERDPNQINAVSLDSFKSLAPRPKDTRFDITKLLKELKYRPLTVREGAERMKHDIGRAATPKGGRG
jgi:dTDP-4-dehydrorhamnose reductase